MEDQIKDILSTASFADADARIACEEKLHSLIGERDDAFRKGHDSRSDQVGILIARAEAAEARAAELEKALAPFAKAGELFADLPPGGYDMLIYRPAAGDKYSIHGNDLRRARSLLSAQEGK